MVANSNNRIIARMSMFQGGVGVGGACAYALVDQELLFGLKVFVVVAPGLQSEQQVRRNLKFDL